MEIEQLNNWFEFVQAYALRESDGFKLIDTTTAGEANAILARLGEIDGSSADDVVVTDIFLTHAHADHYGSAAALTARTGARLIVGSIDAPVVRGVRQPPPPYTLSDDDQAHYDDIMARVPTPPSASPDRLVNPGEVLHWEHQPTVIASPGHTREVRLSGSPMSACSLPGTRSSSSTGS